MIEKGTLSLFEWLIVFGALSASLFSIFMILKQVSGLKWPMDNQDRIRRSFITGFFSGILFLGVLLAAGVFYGYRPASIFDVFSLYACVGLPLQVFAVIGMLVQFIVFEKYIMSLRRRIDKTKS